jgi:hypothetical protein
MIPVAASIYIFFLCHSLSIATNLHRIPTAMDDGIVTSKTVPITAHGTTVLEVVYNNDPKKVEEIISKYEQWLQE